MGHNRPQIILGTPIAAPFQAKQTPSGLNRPNAQAGGIAADDGAEQKAGTPEQMRRSATIFSPMQKIRPFVSAKSEISQNCPVPTAALRSRHKTATACASKSGWRPFRPQSVAVFCVKARILGKGT